MLGCEQHDEYRPPPPNPDRDPLGGPAPDRRRGLRRDRRLHRHLARDPSGRPAGAGPPLPECGGNLLCSFLLRVSDNRSDAHGCRPPVVRPGGHSRRQLRIPDGYAERGQSARRRPHGRLPHRVLHPARADGGEGRRRNLETRRFGWSGFAVTPTTADDTSFVRLAELTQQLEATTKRLEKRALLAAFLRSLRRDEVAPAVHLIVGRIFAESDARALNVGWATLKKALGRTKQASLVPQSLSILGVSQTFARIAEAQGPDSTRVRRRLLESLLGRASEGERDVLLKNVFGEMRIGVNEGVMLEGIADASGLPEIVGIARALPASEFLLEGGVVAGAGEGKPLPFQDLMRRFRRVHGIESAQEEIPLKLYLFDVLHLDGRTLIDEPYRVRWEFLERLGPPGLLAARRIAQRKEEIEAFLQEALVAGHEGLMAKQLESTYSVGKRGKKWFKIKPADHLDLAITAAEWGSGRREGWLSNYWLAVRDDKNSAFQMIGKTFKGLTDEEFEAMTERLRGLATSEERWGFHVRPETVVEVAYNEIQRSPHYPSGFALRFARIVRIRDDKGPNDVDTYDRLKDLYAKQFERKGRGPDDL